jgi:hypothetical protein
VQAFKRQANLSKYEPKKEVVRREVKEGVFDVDFFGNWLA